MAKPIWGALFKAQDGSFWSHGSATNLKPCRQKFACECNWPPQKLLNCPSDFPPGLSGRGWSSSELTTASVPEDAPAGFLGYAHVMRWFVLMGFPPSREVCWGGVWHSQRFLCFPPGHKRGFPVSGQMGHLLPWSSIGRCPCGPQETPAKPLPAPSNLPSTTGSFRAAAPCLCLHVFCLTFLTLRLSARFPLSLPFFISNFGGKVVNEGRCEQEGKKKKVCLLRRHKWF